MQQPPQTQPPAVLGTPTACDGTNNVSGPSIETNMISRCNGNSVAQGSSTTSTSVSNQVTPAKQQSEPSGLEDPSSNSYDWHDETWDHHFGMENSNAGRPYSNSGRSEAVWKTLVAYGFRRTPNNSLKGPSIPHPCFEYFVRQKVKNPANILVNGEIVSGCISDLARSIRTSRHIGCLGSGVKEVIANMDDDDLVKEALSVGGINNTDLYYSFCRGGLEEIGQSWHCRICKSCK